MKVEPLRTVKAKLSEFIRECQNEPIVITKNGKVSAMLIAATDDDLERLMLATNPQFNELIRKAEESGHQGERISHDDFWADLD